MVEISFVNHTTHNTASFKNIARRLIANGAEILGRKHEKLALSLHFVNDEQAILWNQQYRGKAYVADVLSFPTCISPQEVEAIGYHELGDIVIAIGEAQRKAQKYHHSLETEIAFLVVHGFLHLLGFDHERNFREEQEMFAWQDKILASGDYHYPISSD